jgi:hypothetical protein
MKAFLIFASFFSPLISISVKVPLQTVKIAYWAEVNGDFPIKAQWESKNTTVTYAWDSSSNCYSEYWSSRTLGLQTGYATCKGQRTTYALKRCVSIADSSNLPLITKNYYE